MVVRMRQRKDCATEVEGGVQDRKSKEEGIGRSGKQSREAIKKISVLVLDRTGAKGESKLNGAPARSFRR